MPEYDVAVIGGGPAGIAAATQSHLYGYKTVLIEKTSLGDRLNLARRVKNFPLLGMRGRSGKELVLDLVNAFMSFSVPVSAKKCVSIGFDGECFIVQLDRGEVKAKAVIVTTGCKPRYMAIEGVEAATDTGRLVYEWRSLADKVREKRVFVVGGGEVAFDQACSLLECGAQVDIIIRSSTHSAYDALVNEALALGANPIFNAKVTGISMQGEKVVLTVKRTDRTEQMLFDYGLVAIGSEPHPPAISPDALARLQNGLFLAGDVVKDNFHQAAIAYGDGINAAMLVHRYLNGESA